MKFEVFVGIDQTGAVFPSGKPRPLHACVYDPKRRKLHTNLSLQSASSSEIRKLLNELKLPDQGVFVGVDAALGLPKSLGVKFQTLLADVIKFSHEGRSYGARTAHAFYRQYLPDPDMDPPWPRREAEVKVGANSVFALTPYQRNIGCGSYRVLRDLAKDLNTNKVWPFSVATKAQQMTFAECYPSYLWSTVFALPKRSLSDLSCSSELKRLVSHKTEFFNADAGDACVAALGSYVYVTERNFMAQTLPRYASSYEGWILGV